MDRNKSDSVKTAARTLDLFEVFAQTQAPLSLTDLSQRLHAPISSCHALVRTLQSRGYLYVLERRKRVYPTKRMLQVVEAIAGHDPLLEAVAPVLERLRDRLGETVILGNRQEDSVIYLEVVEGTHTVRYAAKPGDAKPLHSSAIGKAMLSGLKPDQLRALLERLPLARVTANTLTDIDTLLDDIEQGRRNGYFVTRGENVEDVSAIAIRREVNGEPFGIAIAGPSERLSRNFDAYCRELIAQGDALCNL
ncbi:MAG TPA: IclR family transcriptional regulator [Rhodocyclaceae bacterium]|nr:IclR family transcriptional regulator [Rhodocyclaceae bacterium]